MGAKKKANEPVCVDFFRGACTNNWSKGGRERLERMAAFGSQDDLGSKRWSPVDEEDRKVRSISMMEQPKKWSNPFENPCENLSLILTYRHPFLCDQLHCMSLELTAEMTILFPHEHLLPYHTNF